MSRSTRADRAGQLPVCGQHAADSHPRAFSPKRTITVPNPAVNRNIWYAEDAILLLMVGRRMNIMLTFEPTLLVADSGFAPTAQKSDFCRVRPVRVNMNL